MKFKTLLLILVSCLILNASLWAHQLTKISLAEVPELVVETARTLKPGILFTEFEKIDDDGTISYELEGILDSKEVEFHIMGNGVLIDMEIEEDD